MQSPIPSVRLIIPDSEGKILILRRTNTSHAQGAWCLPGGKVDYGETVEHAVIKELKEETSLDCTSSTFLFYNDSLPDEEGGMHCINFFFQCSVRGDINLNDESGQYAWIGPDDISKYDIVFRNDEAILKYWKQQA